jgi:hypothetical protein
MKEEKITRIRFKLFPLAPRNECQKILDGIMGYTWESFQGSESFFEISLCDVSRIQKNFLENPHIAEKFKFVIEESYDVEVSIDNFQLKK